MQQRISASGRPSGTDGFDYSYRMVVDSRYTKVTRFKSRLSRILLIQVIIALAGSLLILLQYLKGEDPNVLALSSVVSSFFSLIIGESGRRNSRTTVLKVYLILSFIAMLLSVACAMKINLLLEVLEDGVSTIWVKQRIQLSEAVRVVVGAIVQIFAASTVISLMHNMSPPKRSS